jgi:hypothetical protein
MIHYVTLTPADPNRADEFSVVMPASDNTTQR